MRIAIITASLALGACGLTPGPADPNDQGNPSVTVRFIEQLENGRVNSIVDRRASSGGTDQARFGCEFISSTARYRDVSRTLTSGTVVPPGYFEELASARGSEYVILQDDSLENKFFVNAQDEGGVARIEVTYVVGYRSISTGEDWIPGTELFDFSPASVVTSTVSQRDSSRDDDIREFVQTVTADFSDEPLLRANLLSFSFNRDLWSSPRISIRVIDGGGRETTARILLLPQAFCS